MIDVEIKNFQAIDELDLTIEGFTVLVGRTNIGKSSIVRALKTALSGGSGSDFVRHDARSCNRIISGAKSCKCHASVKVMFGEGQGFLWEKGAKGINRYTVWKDGKPAIYDRVGQSMELPEVLGAEFAPVKVGTSQSLLQVSSQFEAPFLLDLSASAVADILSDIGQLDEINHAMAAVGKDRRAAAATRKVRESDVADLERQLVAYETLDGHLAAVNALNAQASRVTATSDRLRALVRLYDEVSAAGRMLQKVRIALERPVPDSGPVVEVARRLAKMHEYQDVWRDRLDAVAALESAVRQGLPNAAILSSVARRWQKVTGWQNELTRRTQAVDALATVDQVSVPPAVSWTPVASLKKITHWIGVLGDLKGYFDRASKLQRAALPEPAPLISLCERVSELRRFTMALEQLEQGVEYETRMCAEGEKDLAEILAEFEALGVCPTCKQAISPNHVVVTCPTV